MRLAALRPPPVAHAPGSPPRAATKGGTFTYPIAVRSKKGGVKFKWEASPTGMTLSKDGVVTWAVPTGFVEAQTNVIVSITDAGGQERFHSFTLNVGQQ